MLESPGFQRLVVDAIQQRTFDLLRKRFGNVPEDVRGGVRKLRKEKRKLAALHSLAAACPSLDAFRAALFAGPGPHLGGQQALLDEEHAFLVALAASADEAGWRVYADWLDDQGEVGC